MAGKTNTSATFFAQKKLLGKAHTSNLKIDNQESIGSNIQAATSLVFGETIPTSPNLTLNSVQGGTVEYIQFVLTALTGTTYDANSSGGGDGSDAGESSQASGPHAYKFVLPANYEASTNNSRAGNGIFDDNVIVHETLGSLQLIPPFFSQDAPNPYIVKIYEDNSGSPGTQIPLEDNIDWSVDFYNGILFLQDYDASKIPAFAKCFAYVGKMASEVISAGGGSAAGSDTQIQFNDGGTSFGGDSGLTFNKTTDTLSTINLTGSLTALSDGSAYINAGTGVTISTGSNGAITINSSGGTDLSGMQFVTFGSEANLSNERILTAGDGITISTATPQQIAISANRTKKFFDITGSHANSKPFDCHTMNFSSVDYDPNRIDVFLNGQSLRTGSSQDYLLQPTGSILFYMDLEIEDIVQVVIF